MPEQGRYERSRIVAGRGMDDHAFGFVDKDDIAVFIDDIERDVFCRDLKRDWRRQFQFDDIFCGNLIVFRYAHAVDGNRFVVGGKQLLCGGTRQLGVLRQKHINTDTGVFGFNGQKHRRIPRQIR